MLSRELWNIRFPRYNTFQQVPSQSDEPSYRINAMKKMVFNLVKFTFGAAICTLQQPVSKLDIISSLSITFVMMLGSYFLTASLINLAYYYRREQSTDPDFETIDGEDQVLISQENKETDSNVRATKDLENSQGRKLFMVSFSELLSLASSQGLHRRNFLFYIAITLIVCTCFFVNVAYVHFLVDDLLGGLSSSFPWLSALSTRYMLVLPAVTFLALIPTFERLAAVSLFGLTMIAFAIGILFTYGLLMLWKGETNLFTNLSPDRGEGLSQWFGSAEQLSSRLLFLVYCQSFYYEACRGAYNDIIIAMTVSHSEEQEQEQSKQIVDLLHEYCLKAMGLIFFITLLIGWPLAALYRNLPCLCKTQGGECDDGFIFNKLPPSTWLIPARLSMFLELLCSVPIVLTTGIAQIFSASSRNLGQYNRLLRILSVLLIALVAHRFSSAIQAMGVVSDFFLMTLSIFLPALMMWINSGDLIRPQWQTWFFVLLTIGSGVIIAFNAFQCMHTSAVADKAK